MADKKIRVFAVDDHKFVTDSLASILNGTLAEDGNLANPAKTSSTGGSTSSFAFMGRADNAEQLFERLKGMHQNIDIILMDIRLSGDMNGLEATKKVKELYPDIKVIMLTEINDKKKVSDAVQNCANGYISKSLGKEDLLHGIQKVMKGEFVVLTSEIRSNTPPQQSTGPLLSEMEEIVLYLTVKGKTADEVATQVNLSSTNVNRIRNVLMKKFEVDNVAGLVREAILRGYYKDDSDT